LTLLHLVNVSARLRIAVRAGIKILVKTTLIARQVGSVDGKSYTLWIIVTCCPALVCAGCWVGRMRIQERCKVFDVPSALKGQQGPSVVVAAI